MGIVIIVSIIIGIVLGGLVYIDTADKCDAIYVGIISIIGSAFITTFPVMAWFSCYNYPRETQMEVIETTYATPVLIDSIYGYYNINGDYVALIKDKNKPNTYKETMIDETCEIVGNEPVCKIETYQYKSKFKRFLFFGFSKDIKYTIDIPQGE